MKTTAVVQRIVGVGGKGRRYPCFVINSASPTTHSLTALLPMKNFQNSLVVLAKQFFYSLSSSYKY